MGGRQHGHKNCASRIGSVGRSVVARGGLEFWTKADKPFLFLAACVELTKAMSFGPGYVCSLPVSWDGSCSGLQHLCAMTRSEEGKHVNLTNLPEPQDVYQ
jgi:DNA-directed RNA polymerase